MSNPTVLTFADLGPDGERVAAYMTWGLAAAIDDDTARAILTVADWCRVNWALEEGGMLAKARAFISEQAPPPWASIPKVRQHAAFLTVRALVDSSPEKFASAVQATLSPDRPEAC
jgi:hypothetical protein